MIFRQILSNNKKSSLLISYFISCSTRRFCIQQCRYLYNFQISQLVKAVMVEVSQDIFYQVKKEILDKLDLILQKINLQIINYLHPQQQQFSFIQLSSFQTQLSHLFHYLDRLYASLNSSVSFSSINSCRSTVEVYQAENHRLTSENLKLQEKIQNLQLQKRKKHDKIIPINKKQNVIKSADVFNILRRGLESITEQYHVLSKDIKKILKKYKFQLLQSRVQIISKLKQLQHASFNTVKFHDSDVKQNSKLNMHLEEDGQQILQMVNEILSIC